MQKQGKSARIALVGEMLEVIESKNRALSGLSGQAIDETRNTIKIQTKKGTKTIIKDQVTIKVKNRIIEGKKLLGRIEGRIKNSV
jgi:RNase P/RNase MRP subunit p29